METRVEKYKRRQREKRIKRLKIIIIFILISLLILGLNVVNETAREFNCLLDTNIFKYDLNNNTLELFGKTYFIDFKIIKEYF